MIPRRAIVFLALAALLAPTLALAAAPTVELTANGSNDFASIVSGGTVTLEWYSLNADDCDASGGWFGSKTPNVSSEETMGPLTSDKTYTLTCSNVDGPTSSTVTVTVTAAPAAPPAAGGSPPAAPAAGGSQSVFDYTGIPKASPTSVKLNDIISNIMGFAFGLLIILAALFIVVAAYLYLTSGGSTEKVGTAHKFIIYAVVALVAAALSQTIVFIVRSLIGF